MPCHCKVLHLKILQGRREEAPVFTQACFGAQVVPAHQTRAGYSHSWGGHYEQQARSILVLLLLLSSLLSLLFFFCLFYVFFLLPIIVLVLGIDCDANIDVLRCA